MSKRIILCHRYFWPDTPPYATILLEIARTFERKGHDVIVLSAMPSYRKADYQTEAVDAVGFDGKIKIVRFRLLSESGRYKSFYTALNYIYFPLRVLVYLLADRKFNVVMCSTIPTVLMGFFTALGAKLTNSDFYYHCMDLHPEIGALSGEFKNPLVYKLLFSMESWTCRMAKAVIVLSGDMKNSVRLRGREREIHIINNFPIPADEESPALNEVFLKKKNMFRILFAGNIGRFQGLDCIPEAMQKLVEYENIEFVFLGDGKMKGSIVNQVKSLGLEERVKFFNHVNVEAAREMMRDADFGLVSLMDEVYKYAYPSKMVTYLENGCPILAIVEPDSELCSTVMNAGIGYFANSKSPEDVARMFLDAYLERASNKDISDRCIKYVNDTQSQLVVSKQWIDLIDSNEMIRDVS